MRIVQAFVLVAWLLVAWAPVVCKAQVLTNGGFDDNGGSLDGWTEIVNTNAEPNRGQIDGPQAGTHFAILNTNSQSAFYQSFTTSPGVAYDLSLYAARPQTNNTAFSIDVDVFDGSGGTTVAGSGDLLDANIADGDVGLDPEWVFFQYQFTAASGQATLRFMDGGGGGTSGVDPAIDTVSITPVPEPSSLALLGFGSLASAGIFFFLRSRRKHAA